LDGEILLSVKNIVKQFPGTLALNDVSLSVRKGESHALVGENGAGKSTLMNIIAGVYQANSGIVEFDGKEVNFHNPKDAQDAGIGFVHQELNLCQHLSVAENIYMGAMPKSMGNTINWKQLNADARIQLKRLNADFDATAVVSTLTVAQRQIVEIVKALALNIKLLILDEPTSSLTEQETQLLFKIIEEVKNQGISILYISHRLEEIFTVCESLTVLRDGVVVKSVPIEEINTDQIIQMMVGREIKDRYPPKSKNVGDVFMEVKNFTRDGVFRDVSFEVKKGEILGFYGLVGAGRSEVIRSVCGIDPFQDGEVYLEGKKLKIKNYQDIIDMGVGYITEDRKAQGLFLQMSILQNVSAATLDKVRKGIFIQNAAEQDLAEKFVKMLAVKFSSLTEKVNDLSGGNQQKLMIGKWLAIGPKLLILDEPTRGIDVGAKSEIHKLLRQLCDEGVCIVIISSELPEIMGLADRIVIMHEGIVCGEVAGEEIFEENIIVFASGQSKEQAQVS
jgi:ribose transport system ATP-binding protein